MELLGNAGKAVNPRPFPEFDPQEDGGPIRTGSAVPSPCAYVLHDPFGKAECPWSCAGRQRDGSCLCDIIKSYAEKGAVPEFWIDQDGYWTLT